MLGALQKYMPAADTLLSLLGEQQRKWLDANAEQIAPFLVSEEGKAALLLFLEEFGDYVLKAKTK